MTNDEYKNCPYCDERIKAIAVKCRYCKSMLIKESNNSEYEVEIKNDNAKTEETIMNSSSEINKAPRIKSKSQIVFYIIIGLFLFSTVFYFIGSLFHEGTRDTSDSGLSATPDIRGNTVGNITNSGLAVQHNDWVYYINAIGFEGAIFKARTDGSERKMVTNDIAFDLNMVDNWIYYSNANDGYKIYRIQTDGSRREKINDEASSKINIVGDWIYYSSSTIQGSSYEDDFDIDGKIYKIRIDGSERTKLADNHTMSLVVAGDWVYYSNYDDGNKIYRVSIDGSKRKRINKDDSRFLNLAGDWIYYINTDASEYPMTGKVYKIRTDGSGRKKVTDDLAWFLNVDSDWIYYLNVEENIINRVRTEGTERQIIYAQGAWSLNIVGDWIYLINSNDNFNLYKIRTDGSDYTQESAIGIISSKEEIEDEKEPIIEHSIYRVNVGSGNNLRIRKSPGIMQKPESDIVDRLPNGRLVKLVSNHRNSIVVDDYIWWEIIDLQWGASGWVASEYLEVYTSEKPLEHDYEGKQRDKIERLKMDYIYDDPVLQYLGWTKQEIVEKYGNPQATEGYWGTGGEKYIYLLEGIVFIFADKETDFVNGIILYSYYKNSIHGVKVGMTINEINNILGEPDYTEATGATDLGGYLYAYPIGEKLNGEYEVDFKVTTWRENGSTHEGLILWNAYWW